MYVVSHVIHKSSSVTLITPHIAGECFCHELVVDVSKRMLCYGACQPATNLSTCVLPAAQNVTMISDEALTKDEMPCGNKEVTTYIFLGC